MWQPDQTSVDAPPTAVGGARRAGAECSNVQSTSSSRRPQYRQPLMVQSGLYPYPARPLRRSLVRCLFPCASCCCWLSVCLAARRPQTSSNRPWWRSACSARDAFGSRSAPASRPCLPGIKVSTRTPPRPPLRRNTIACASSRRRLCAEAFEPFRQKMLRRHRIAPRRSRAEAAHHRGGYPGPGLHQGAADQPDRARGRHPGRYKGAELVLPGRLRRQRGARASGRRGKRAVALVRLAMDS